MAFGKMLPVVTALCNRPCIEIETKRICRPKVRLLKFNTARYDVFAMRSRLLNILTSLLMGEQPMLKHVLRYIIDSSSALINGLHAMDIVFDVQICLFLKSVSSKETILLMVIIFFVLHFLSYRNNRLTISVRVMKNTAKTSA